MGKFCWWSRFHFYQRMLVSMDVDGVDVSGCS